MIEKLFYVRPSNWAARVYVSPSFEDTSYRGKASHDGAFLQWITFADKIKKFFRQREFGETIKKFTWEERPIE